MTPSHHPQNPTTTSPRTPSFLLRDNFDLTPQTQTTDSFADSGFFSTSTSPGLKSEHKYKYEDWILFPEDKEVVEGGALGADRFFEDADLCVQQDFGEEGEDEGCCMVDGEESPSSSIELSPYRPEHELCSAFQQYTLSSPSQPPPSPTPRNLDLPSNFNYGPQKQHRYDDLDMLTHWQQTHHRHEMIAYNFEQAPYTEREHLLPVWRQDAGIRKRRSGGQGKKARGRSVRS